MRGHQAYNVSVMNWILMKRITCKIIWNGLANRTY